MHIEVMDRTPKIVRVIGEVDITNSAQLAAALDIAVTESPQGVIVDMSDVTYLDSTGIHTLLVSGRRLGAYGGKLLLVLGQASIRRVFDILHLDGYAGLRLCRDTASAERALDEPDPGGEKLLTSGWDGVRISRNFGTQRTLSAFAEESPEVRRSAIDIGA